MLSRLSVLALMVAALAACSSDSAGPKVFDSAKLRVRIVSGNNQSAPVASSANPVVLPTGAVLAQLTGLEILEEPLVVQLVDGGSGAKVQAAEVAPGTQVSWAVDEAGCGRPFSATTPPESDGRAVNYWVKGTKAGFDCPMYAGRIVGGAPVIDSVFVSRFQPGAVTSYYFSRPPAISGWIVPGQMIDLRPFLNSAMDRHKNKVDPSLIPNADVVWEWRDWVTTGVVLRGNGTPVPGSGWSVPVPDFKALGYSPSVLNENQYAPYLAVWIRGMETQGSTVSFYVHLY